MGNAGCIVHCTMTPFFTLHVNVQLEEILPIISGDPGFSSRYGELKAPGPVRRSTIDSWPVAAAPPLGREQGCLS